MAEFCKQCSEAHFGADMGDFAGISTEENTFNGLYPQVLCEGCGGYILVDHTGRRVTDYVYDVITGEAKEIDQTS